MNEGFIEALRQTLPPTFSRQVAAANLSAIYSAGRLANLDSKGEGPGGVRIGRVVCYARENVLSWLERRLTPPSSNKRLGGCA